MDAIVETNKLTKVFRIGKVEVPALRGVDVSVARGEFVAIVGPSGCGKSTMLHILGGLLSPTSGSVLLDGVDMAAVSDRERTEARRRKIGFVFQRFNLFPALSARDNLSLAKTIRGSVGLSEKEESDLLKALGLSAKLDHKPLELSGGEQQRFAIARAVISRPAILLADEPTGSLDSENSEVVLRMLQEMNRHFGQTTIMITHNTEAAATAHRILEMRDGRVVRQSVPPPPVETALV